MLRRHARHPLLRALSSTPLNSISSTTQAFTTQSGNTAAPAAVSKSRKQEWGQGSRHTTYFTHGSFAAGLLVAASSSTLLAQAEPRSGNSVPVSETATHPLDDEAVTNEHTAKMSMARNAALEYYQAGRYELAEKKFKEAVEESILGFGCKDPHVASAKNNLAEFYRNIGQHRKAEQLYQEALELLESAYGEKHWLYVSAMHNLALSYEAIGELEAARKAMEQVMRLRLEMFGPSHFLYADTMFALGNIQLKQANLAQKKQQAEAADQKPGHSQPAEKLVPNQAGWWFRWRGWRRGGPQSSEREALGMMQDAIAILESAENVQTNVVVLWLEKLASELQDRGHTQEAANCIRKAMHYFAEEKGEALAEASQLSDSLVELLLLLGDLEAARDTISKCVSARTQVFGRQLVVCQSMLWLASLELKLGKRGDPQAALQHATNAANLSGELTEEYAKQVDSWKKRLNPKLSDLAVNRVRAAYVHSTAHKFLAENGPQPERQGHLRTAIAALKPSAVAASQYICDLSASQARRQEQQGTKGSGSPPSQLDALADLFVDTQLLLLDCVEALTSLSQDSAELERLGLLAENILEQLSV